MSYLKNFYYFNKVIYQQRYIIRKLVARDFQKKYLSTYLGMVWAFINPLVYILTIWFVVSIGLRSGEGLGYAFLPWLVSAMIPWFFIRDGLSNAAGSLVDYSFLIKKMYFRVGIIPLIKLFTVLIIHLFMLVVLIIIVVLYGFYPTIYWIQIPYYLLCALVLLIGMGWLTSALMVFVRDIKQSIEVFNTLFFWLTPIIWPHEGLTGPKRLLVDLNPFFYITNGYRETFIHGKWFFEQVNLTIYFWCVAIFFFVVGAIVFQKLKPHYADVL
ncbi:MAG TPA: ABC transporter permease [Tenuifilaceae bacterium]|nr:ABC transporter permease [Tenuifilaceae bacterium]